MKKILSINGKVTFNGQGSINNDSNDQKFTLIKLGLIGGKVNDNCTFHKKEFFVENGVNKFKYKVSHDCIRHAMFQKEMPYYNGGITLLPQVLYNAITSPHMIARGYMFTSDNTFTNKTIKKTSIFTITDALATDANTMVPMDINSRAGDRGEKEKIEFINEKGETEVKTNGSTSFFSTENVGKHKYVASFGINLSELQFISLDDIYGRCAADVSHLEYKDLYCKSLKRNFNTGEDVCIKPYYLKTSIMGEECAEEGIVLSPKMVDKVVHMILNKIIGIKIERPSHGGRFMFDSMVLTVNYNDGTSEDITVNTIEDIKDLFFDYEQVYFEADDEMISKRDKEIARIQKEKKNRKKAEKDTKKESKKKGGEEK